MGYVKKSPPNPYGKFGGPTQSSNEHGQYHDFIKSEVRTKVRILKTCALLSEQSQSLREMEERTGIAKTTIQETLRDLPRRSVKRKDGYPPFGYIYFDGKLVSDPKEQIVIRKILNLLEHLKGYQDIANELNAKKIRTRFGMQWRKSTIRSLVLRVKEN